MSFMIAVTLILISATFIKADVSLDLKKCREQVVTKCQCGVRGNLTDVYVDGCQTVLNESCQPCSGSCRVFLNCQTCSKYDCTSCPFGKTGPTCERNELLQNANYIILEKNQNNFIQNVTEAPFLDTTRTKVSNVNLNGTLPKIIIFDVSQIANSSFQAETHKPEMKLDLIEFVTGNTSIIEVMPDEKLNVFEKISSSNSENLSDLSEVCTSNCSSVQTNEATNHSLVNVVNDPIGNNSNNEIGTFRLDEETEFENLQRNESTDTSSESNAVPNIYKRLKTQDSDDVTESPHVNVPENDWVKEYATYNEDDFGGPLLKHRSPNPSTDEENTMVVSSEKNGMENLQYEDEQILENPEHDYPENPVVSDTQETIEDVENPTDSNLKRPILKRVNNTSTEYIITYEMPNDENESKDPEIEKEAPSPSEEDPDAAVKLDETDELETVQSSPEQQYDFSKPHTLKRYFDSQEIEDSKSETNTSDLWKNLCKFFPATSVCRSRESAANDKNTLQPRIDPQSHVEHTFSYFRSPEYPGNKLLFSDTKDLLNDRPVDKIKHLFMDYPDTIQQSNEDLLDRLDNIQRPVPQSVGIYDQQNRPSQAYYSNQGYPMNQSPILPFNQGYQSQVPPKNTDINSAMTFQKGLFPSLFDHLLHLIGPHIQPYQGSSFSGEKREYSSPGIVQGPPSTMFRSIKSFPQAPVQARGAPNLFGDYNFRSLSDANSFNPLNFQGADSNYLFSDQRMLPVLKGQILIANIGNENGTSRIIPGSIRSRNFEFEVPMMMPFHGHNTIHSGKKSSRNLKRAKSAKRLRKLHKRRRNGVRENISSNTNDCNPWKEDCTKNRGNGKNIDSYNDYSGRKMKRINNSRAWRKGGSIPDRIRIKYMTMQDDANTASAEIITSSKSSATENNAAQLHANDSAVPPQQENVVNESFIVADEILQASDQSDSDPGSNQPLSRGRRSTNSHFCPIPKESRNGDIDCTIWSYKKTCILTCHSGYSSPHQQFTCTRSKNTWTPPMTSCTGGLGFEPDDENSILLKTIEEEPENLDEEEETGEKSHGHEELSHEDYDHNENVEHSEEGEAEDHEAEATTRPPKKHHAKTHEAKKTKKKAHVNSLKMHEESHEEAEHPHESKEHMHGHKHHGKGEHSKHHNRKKTEIVKEEHPKKEEEEDLIQEALNGSEEEQKDTSEKNTEEDLHIEEAEDKPEYDDAEQDEAYDSYKQS